MTGDRGSGAELLDLGLVTFLVDDGEIAKKALERADRLAADPAIAIRASKLPINQFIRMVSNLVLPLSLSMEGESMRSQDAREARAAFAEKRPPSFTGR